MYRARWHSLTSGGILFTKCAHRAHRAADPELRNSDQRRRLLRTRRERPRRKRASNPFDEVAPSDELVGF